MTLIFNSNECYVDNGLMYWDFAVHTEGYYDFYANVSWMSNQPNVVLPKKTIKLCVQYPKEVRSEYIYNKTYGKLNDSQSIFLGKLKLKKSESASIELSTGNTNVKNLMNVIRIDEIKITTSKSVRNIVANGISKKEVTHCVGNATVTNIVHTTKNLYGFYHEFGIVRHTNHTNYLFNFNGGVIRANYDNGTMEFKIYDNEPIKSQIAARNSVTTVTDNDNSITVALQHNLKLRHMYKVFVKIDHGMYGDKEITNYHAYFGSVSNNRWYFIATIRRYGNHTLNNMMSILDNVGNNGHLESRDMSYGRTWYFINDTGDILKNTICYPVQQFIFGQQDISNSRLLLYPRLYRVFMQVGAGMGTTTPINTIGMKRKDNIPTIPIDFMPI